VRSQFVVVLDVTDAGGLLYFANRQAMLKRQPAKLFGADASIGSTRRRRRCLPIACDITGWSRADRWGFRQPTARFSSLLWCAGAR
jgi:hypothetical protein